MLVESSPIDTYLIKDSRSIDRYWFLWWPNLRVPSFLNWRTKVLFHWPVRALDDTCPGIQNQGGSSWLAAPLPQWSWDSSLSALSADLQSRNPPRNFIIMLKTWFYVPEQTCFLAAIIFIAIPLLPGDANPTLMSR